MSIFNNSKPTGSIFGNTTQPQQQGMSGSIFGGNQQTQPQTTGGIFGGGQQTQQTNNIFGGGQTQQPQQTTNIFGGNQTQQQPQQSNIFTQQKTGLFNTQQPQQQTTTGNIFSGGQQQQQQQQTINIFGGGQQQQPFTQGSTNIFGPQQQQTNLNQLFQSATTSNDSQRIRFQIEQFCRRIDPKNLQHIRIDEMNMYKDHRLNDLPDDLKKPILILVNNMKDLRKIIDNIKKENDELDNKAATYCKNVQQKLFKYKQSLIQNIQQSNLLEQVRQQVELINTQVTNFIIPLYNAYRTGRHFTFDSPDQFSSIISKNILQKMIELNNKLDEIISCQQSSDDDSLSERDSATLLVLEQLLSYYENVSAKVMEFTNHYNSVKRAKIQSMKRTSSYEQIMRRIQQKVNSKMQKDFKSYDLIKQIESILQKREKRQQQLSNDYYRERRSDLFAGERTGGYGENRWNRF